MRTRVLSSPIHSLPGDLQGLWTPYRFDWHRENDQATSPLDSFVLFADTFLGILDPVITTHRL